jgi:hypothetical protein
MGAFTRSKGSSQSGTLKALKANSSSQEVMEEYLDLRQLTQRIPFSKSVIEELIADGVLVDGIHFRRPTGPSGKRVFFWSAIEAWLKGQDYKLRANHVAVDSRQNLSRLPV